MECLQTHAHCVTRNSHEKVWLRPRTETSDSNYGLEVPDFESESESESESDLEVDASVESDSDVPSVKSSPSSSDAELLALSALINPPPRAATSVASSTSSSDSEPKRQSPRAATSVASSTSSSDSEPEFPAVAQRAATSVASSTSSSDSEPEFPAVAQPSRAATPDEPLSSHHTDWDMDSKAEPEEWDMEETAPVKRSTPQYLIAVKEGEWDEFVAGLVSKNMENVQLPGIVIHHLKYKFPRTLLTIGWDPCPVKVIAPASWSREVNGQHGACWVLKGSKLDGMYVNRQQRNEALLPDTEIYTHGSVEDGLYEHYEQCLKTHVNCVTRNSHERVWMRPRTETSDSNYGLERPIFESESETSSPRAATSDFDSQSDAPESPRAATSSTSDSDSSSAPQPPRAATAVTSAASDSESDTSLRAATSVTSATSDSDSDSESEAPSEPQPPRATKSPRAATSVSSATSDSDSEPEASPEPQPPRAATLSDFEASPNEPLSSHHMDWDMESQAELGPEEWDMESKVKRSTPQYLIDVKEGEWDEFIADLISKK
ncbi:hypothetical protein DFH06DRAFT_1133539 [Mycena polygramma]|nr:hypothetical protein DFH06DRAFT_1133539 [Mycena polygramma]